MLALLIASGCMHPKYASWRLAENVLVPPGVSASTVTQGTFKADVGQRASCPPDIRASRKEVMAKVSRDRLSQRPRGWLTAWAEDLEAQGCIAPGEAFRLANGIVQ